jgi:methylglutaconyl-CoA hydratase
LYANTFDTIELDKAITDFSTKLSSYNPEALLEMKSTLGRNALGHFVTTRRYFGKLVLSDFTKCLGTI